MYERVSGVIDHFIKIVRRWTKFVHINDSIEGIEMEESIEEVMERAKGMFLHTIHANAAN